MVPYYVDRDPNLDLQTSRIQREEHLPCFRKCSLKCAHVTTGEKSGFYPTIRGKVFVLEKGENLGSSATNQRKIRANKDIWAYPFDKCIPYLRFSLH